ncbi:MAG TPA: hypothetical protein PLZ62_03050 [bacterium]|nr:hypothetical protein [bacterium]
MKKKTKNIPNSFALLPNGIWLEYDSYSTICWHKNSDYLLFEYKQPASNIFNKIPFIRAYLYLFQQIIGKIKILSYLKKSYRHQTGQSVDILSADKNFFYLIFVKITISLLFIIIFAYIQTTLNKIYGLIFFDHIGIILFQQTLWLFLQIFLIYLIIYILAGHQIFRQICKYRHALRLCCQKYLRNEIVFFILLTLFAIYWGKIVSMIFYINFWFVLFVIFPIIYEINNYAEKHLDNFLFFVFYSPIYFFDKQFIFPSSENEQKCILLALDE